MGRFTGFALHLCSFSEICVLYEVFVCIRLFGNLVDRIGIVFFSPFLKFVSCSYSLIGCKRIILTLFF